MTTRTNHANIPPFHEPIDKRDIRNSFRLSRLDDPMLDRTEWPPKFPSHEGYSSNFPVWGGYSKIPMSRQNFTDEDFGSDSASDASGGSSGSGGRSKFIRGPRIHHIPILVEARDGNSSGYSSDTTTGEDRSSGQSQSKMNGYPQQQDSGRRPPVKQPQTHTDQSRWPQNNQQSRQGYENPPQPQGHGGQGHHQHQATPQYQTGGAHRSMSDQQFGSRPETVPHQRKSASQPPGSPPAKEEPPVHGPFLTRVRLNAPAPLVEGQSAVSAPSGQERKAKKEKPDPMKQIKSILDDMKELKDKVDQFAGVEKDRDYRYLDEMLTRLMLKLDDVDTEGQDDIRSERKKAVKQIQMCITALEDKVVENDKLARERHSQNGHHRQEDHSQPEGTAGDPEEGSDL